MSSVQVFVCHDCAQSWRDKYSFWNGYQSTCPRCGKACEAVCDSQVFADQREWKGFYDAPVFDFEDAGREKTEADLEADRDVIHDEIAEALGAVETDVSDPDSDADEDGDSGAEGDGS